MKIIEVKKNEVSVELKSIIYKYWIHGLGLIPLRKNPVLLEDAYIKEFKRSKIQLKDD